MKQIYLVLKADKSLRLATKDFQKIQGMSNIIASKAELETLTQNQLVKIYDKLTKIQLGQQTKEHLVSRLWAFLNPR